MIKVRIAVLLGMALLSNTTLKNADIKSASLHHHDTECPFNVYDCACTYPGYTGGDQGHFPHVNGIN